MKQATIRGIDCASVCTNLRLMQEVLHARCILNDTGCISLYFEEGGVRICVTEKPESDAESDALSLTEQALQKGKEEKEQ